ncbi:hypothetical protein V8E54_012547 [Elaphomyces granulatus]
MTVSFFVYSLRKEFEMHLGRPISGRHTSKKDVKYLADLIFSEGSISPTKPRSCPHQSLNLTGKGSDAVYSGAIPAFNQQLSDFQGPGGSSYQTAGKRRILQMIVVTQRAITHVMVAMQVRPLKVILLKAQADARFYSLVPVGNSDEDDDDDDDGQEED